MQEQIYYYVWVDPDDDEPWICSYTITGRSPKGYSITFTADPKELDDVIKRRKSHMLAKSKIEALKEFQERQFYTYGILSKPHIKKLILRIVRAENMINALNFCPSI